MPSTYIDHAPTSDIARDKARQHGIAIVSAAASSSSSSSSPSSPSPSAAAAAAAPASAARIDDANLPAQRPRTRSWDYMWRSGVAGGFAGCAAKTLVAPLDRVKILFQASNPLFAKYTGSSFGVATAMRDIYHHEGGRGLFRGHSATLLRIFPYAGIKFLAYEQIRAVIIPSKNHETPLRRLLSGSLAGVTSVFFTYPLEVMRVRLAFETKRDGRSSLSSICRQIYNEQPVDKSATTTTTTTTTNTAAAAAATSTSSKPPHALAPAPPRRGLVNFYRGFSPTVLGMLPYAGMSFLTHDTMTDLLLHPSIAAHTTLPQKKGQSRPPGKRAALRSWAELTAGGVAGMISQTASYPLEVIRRRMQVGGAVGDGHRLRIGETAAMILRERGPRGFFVGLTIGYVKVIPMVAVSFYTYERMKLVFGI